MDRTVMPRARGLRQWRGSARMVVLDPRAMCLIPLLGPGIVEHVREGIQRPEVAIPDHSLLIGINRHTCTLTGSGTFG